MTTVSELGSAPVPSVRSDDAAPKSSAGLRPPDLTRRGCRRRRRCLPLTNHHDADDQEPDEWWEVGDDCRPPAASVAEPGVVSRCGVYRPASVRIGRRVHLFVNGDECGPYSGSGRGLVLSVRRGQRMPGEEPSSLMPGTVSRGATIGEIGRSDGRRGPRALHPDRLRRPAGSGSLPRILADQPVYARAADHFSADGDRDDIGPTRRSQTQAAMRSVPVVVLDVLGQSRAPAGSLRPRAAILRGRPTADRYRLPLAHRAGDTQVDEEEHPEPLKEDSVNREEVGCEDL